MGKTSTDPPGPVSGTGVSTEAELLLCCARSCPDLNSVECVNTRFRAETEWAVLLEIARRHGMMPLLYWHLDALRPQAVPKVAYRRLRDHFHDNAGKNLRLAGELLSLMALFEAHCVRALPFKGPLLAAPVYGSLALREAGDLDVLVRRQDVLRVRDLLISQGYLPLVERTVAQEAALLHSHWEYQFVSADGRVTVEVHWRITPHWEAYPAHRSSPLNLERLWERRQTTALLGVSIAGPSPEDLLLMLCVHGAKHLWQRLRWITDVAELMRVHPDLDWERMIFQAEQINCRRICLLGLLLARDLLSAALPAAVEQRINADASLKSLAAQVKGWLFRLHDDPLGLSEECVFHLRLRERLRDRLPYLRHYLRAMVRRIVTPNAEDRSVLCLPRPFFWLYYVLRPIRLVGKHGFKSLSRLSPCPEKHP